jgi:hypothetical protein
MVCAIFNMEDISILNPRLFSCEVRHINNDSIGEFYDFMNHEKTFYGFKIVFNFHGYIGTHDYNICNYFIKFFKRSENDRILVLLFVPDNVSNELIESLTFTFDNGFVYYFDFFDLKPV